MGRFTAINLRPLAITIIIYYYLINLFNFFQALYYAQAAVKLFSDSKQSGALRNKTDEPVDDFEAGADPTKLVEVINLLKNKNDIVVQETSLA